MRDGCTAQPARAGVGAAMPYWSCGLHLCFRREQLLHFIVGVMGFSTHALKYWKEAA